MISFLRGELRSLDLHEVVVDVGGVGYGVRTPLSTFYELEARGLGAAVELLIHTQVRESAIELYGFLSSAEKQIFERLISVSGIGPKLAQGILSGMAPPDLLRALAEKDVAKLVRIPGIGKKTAQRLVLELHDKARTMLEELGDVAVPRGPSDDLVAALVGLGYRAREAQKAAAEVLAGDDEISLAKALKLALRKLSRV